MIDPEGLDAFVAIAAERSFSVAAQRLGIAQSVISKRLRSLEDRLGASLVDRSNRADIRPTRVGELYLPEAKQALGQLRKVERLGKDLARGRIGPVRIGFIFSAALNGTLSTMLRHLAESLPAIELKPSLMETPEQLEALDRGVLDIALVRPRPSYPASCQAGKVQQEGLELFVAASHRFARQRSISCRELAGERFIVPQFREKVGLINQLEELAATGGFALDRVTRTDDFVTAAVLVASGQGIALAPASLSAIGIEKLVAKPIDDYRRTLELTMVHSANLPDDLLNAVGSIPYDVAIAPPAA